MGPTYIVKIRITLSSVISIAIVAIFLMYISPKISSAFANVNQPIFSVAPNQILTKNNSGIIILENATVIDGTGALPEPNTTIVINGSRIMYVASNTTPIQGSTFAFSFYIVNLLASFYVDRFSAIFYLTGKPGIFPRVQVHSQ
jgi:hypothetical protein